MPDGGRHGLRAADHRLGAPERRRGRPAIRDGNRQRRRDPCRKRQPGCTDSRPHSACRDTCHPSGLHETGHRASDRHHSLRAGASLPDVPGFAVLHALRTRSSSSPHARSTSRTTSTTANTSSSQPSTTSSPSPGASGACRCAMNRTRLPSACTGSGKTAMAAGGGWRTPRAAESGIDTCK